MIMVKHRTSVLFKLTCFLLTYHNTKQFRTIKKRENYTYTCMLCQSCREAVRKLE